MGGRRSRGMNGSFHQHPISADEKNGEQNEGRTKLKGEQNEEEVELCEMFDVMNEKNAHKEMKNEEKKGKRLSCTSPY